MNVREPLVLEASIVAPPAPIVKARSVVVVGPVYLSRPPSMTRFAAALVAAPMPPATPPLPRLLMLIPPRPPVAPFASVRVVIPVYVLIPLRDCTPSPVLVRARLAGVAAVRTPVKTAFVLSLPTVKVTALPELVTTPAPARDPTVSVLAARSSMAPSEMERPAASGSKRLVPDAPPRRRIPPVMLVLPVQLLAAPVLDSTSTPGPALVSPVPLVICPARNPVTKGLSTVRVRAPAPRFTAPVR